MTLDRRSMLTAGIGAGIGAGLAAGIPGAAHAGPRDDRLRLATAAVPRATDLGLEPDIDRDQSAALQRAIDAAASRGEPLVLPPGRYRVASITLRSGSRIIGAHGATVLEYTGGDAFLRADGVDGLRIEYLTLDGGYKQLSAADALLRIDRSKDIELHGLTLTRSPANGISLASCSGTISDCNISSAMQAGIHSLDADGGFDIRNNCVADCANNGIQVWRSNAGIDGSTVSGNRIERIRADSGGTGENGNGVNVFRAGGVLVANNRITDCAYSAVRGNAASDIQIIANSCARLGEVALYAEFGFEGALIASNLVDTAATGISVTNFNDGGRLGVVQGNLIRNLFRREHEPEDKRGNGIAVEADTAVIGNTIEGAPTAGIVLGWGRYLRDVITSSNIVRASKVGILVSSEGGPCLLSGNMISGASDGAIRAMDGSGTPQGPDLAQGGSAGAPTHISLTGNLAV